MNYMEFDTTPSDEPCASLGEANYHLRSLLEFEAISCQLKRQFPKIMDKVQIKLGVCEHDFGTYHEVRLRWDPLLADSEKSVFKMESNWPEKWDDEARQFLEDEGYFSHQNSEA